MKKEKDKVLSEEVSRKNIYANAKRLGIYNEMKQIFDKYDKLLRLCKNEKERSDIQKLGVYEIHMLLGGVGDLYTGGKVVDGKVIGMELVYKDPEGRNEI